MWEYPVFDPVAISLGPISIHWYALSYLVGIGCVWWRLNVRARMSAGRYTWNEEQVSDLVFYAVLGIIIGGRVGYMLFYGRDQIAENPLVILKVWQGGMSFHGGMLGVFIAMATYARLHKRTFFEITDYIAPSVPIALGAGRIGNFINGELPGRVTDVPWAAIYPGDIVGRHPSSLYQAFTEGLVLFCLLWLFNQKEKPKMAVSGMFLLGYGALRFITEFFREPDAHMGFVAFGWASQGQMLSMPMIIIGIGFIIYSYQKNTLSSSNKLNK